MVSEAFHDIKFNVVLENKNDNLPRMVDVAILIRALFFIKDLRLSNSIEDAFY